MGLVRETIKLELIKKFIKYNGIKRNVEVVPRAGIEPARL
jgi:hypothetical protein